MAPLDDIAHFILDRISQDYCDPADVLAYDGGYVGPTYTTRELLTEQVPLDLAPDHEEAVLDELVDRLPEAWARRDTYYANEYEVLDASWQTFRRLVLRRSRFFFLTVGVPPDGTWTELLNPTALLRAVGEVASEAGLFRQLPEGQVFYRSRRPEVGEVLTSALQLGPPCAAQADSANRMNPPGIPLFYGAEDAATAIEETYGAVPGQYSIGQFVARRPLLVLDLRNVPDIPEYFSGDSRTQRQTRFLQELRNELARPVARDNRNHIEYVPTQVVAEFFRTSYQDRGEPVMGILWPSARGGGWCAALFADRADLVLTPAEVGALDDYERERRGASGGWLELVGHEIVVHS